jgi:hypothetical protein
MGEIRLHLVQSRQRLRAILDVSQEKAPSDDTPGVIANWDSAVFKPSILTVEAPQTMFHLTGSTGSH